MLCTAAINTSNTIRTQTGAAERGHDHGSEISSGNGNYMGILWEWEQDSNSGMRMGGSGNERSK